MLNNGVCGSVANVCGSVCLTKFLEMETARPAMFYLQMGSVPQNALQIALPAFNLSLRPGSARKAVRPIIICFTE